MITTPTQASSHCHATSFSLIVALHSHLHDHNSQPAITLKHAPYLAARSCARPKPGAVTFCPMHSEIKRCKQILQSDQSKTVQIFFSVVVVVMVMVIVIVMVMVGQSIVDRSQSKWDQMFAPSECGEGQPSDDRRGETESAPTRHRRRDHRNVIIIVGMTEMNHIQNWCVIEDDQEIASHRASRSAPAHCRRPQGQWHHNTVIIRSGRRSVSNSKSL